VECYENPARSYKIPTFVIPVKCESYNFISEVCNNSEQITTHIWGMRSTAIIQRKNGATLHHYARSAIRTASFSVLERTRANPAGFINALAHEIRNPLCNINLARELMELGKLDEEQRQYLGIIMRGCGRIDELVSRFLTLDLAKEAHFEVYSLHQLLDEVLLITRDRVLLKNISVTRDYTAKEHKVFLDAERVKIAITNIVINAIDAVSLGMGELRLVTRSTDVQSSIEIHDNGIGIGKEDLKRIFEPYFSKKLGGMGVGLSATLDILRANHTGVDVRSAPGVGTCFVLSFDRR
jgi:signal transduction histidine kinase